MLKTNEVKTNGLNTKKKMLPALICGILGCLCYGGGDWLMMYGNTAYSGELLWLTGGVVQIPAWRNTLAMILAFPGIILYGIALFYIGTFIREKKEQTIYHYLNAFGLTPWICLHIFYIMILYMYAWMTNNGYSDAALVTCEALYHHLAWVVIASEMLMLPVFVYWFYLVASGKTILPRIAASGNVLVFYLILKIVVSIMPDTEFRIGFMNGLMSESMLLFFIVNWICARKCVGRPQH